MAERIRLSESDLFVAYRMPKADDYYLLRDDDTTTSDFEFVIHPFDKSSDTPVVSIRNSHVISNPVIDFQKEGIGSLTATPKTAYLDLANHVIDRLQNTDLEKVVLSRIHIVDAPDVNLGELYKNLTITYPNAFVFLYNIPGVGTWMGATPEILTERNHNIITTVALAATQPIDDRSIEDVTWNDKETEEQAIIQRYIEHHLDSASLDYSKGETHTTRAGNVVHLKTMYTIPAAGSIDSLIGQLHPSPAICGMPKEAAMNTIIEGELHDRAYYCGYLGLKTAGRSRLFINLRSMQVFKDQFALYVGGGLTADSNAQSEWEETTTKSKTLASVIQKSYIYSHDDQ